LSGGDVASFDCREAMLPPQSIRMRSETTEAIGDDSRNS